MDNKTTVLIAAAVAIVAIAGVAAFFVTQQNDQGYSTDDSSDDDSGGDSGTFWDGKYAVAIITYFENGIEKKYGASNATELVGFLVNAKGDVIVDLYSNINIGSSSAKTKLVVQPNTIENLTVNFNGYVLEGEGMYESTWVEINGANIVLNGGTKGYWHKYYHLYDAVDFSFPGGAFVRTTLAVIDCTLTANDLSFMVTYASKKGATIMADRSTVTLNNCYFSGNEQKDEGVIYIGNETTMYMNDTRVAGNMAQYGGIVYMGGNNSKLIGNNMVCENNRASAFEPSDFNADGGGIYVEGDNCSISGISFIKVYTTGDGGAFYVEGDYCTITDCTIENSAADYGAAICVEGDHCKISGCTLVACRNYDYGSIYVNGDFCSIDGCKMENCKGHDDAVAIYVNCDYCTIKGCTFTANTTEYETILYVDDKYCTIKGCTFENNTSAEALIYFSYYSYDSKNKPTLDDCTFIGNTPNGKKTISGLGCDEWVGTITIDGEEYTSADFKS